AGPAPINAVMEKAIPAAAFNPPWMYFCALFKTVSLIHKILLLSIKRLSHGLLYIEKYRKVRRRAPSENTEKAVSFFLHLYSSIRVKLELPVPILFISTLCLFRSCQKTYAATTVTFSR